MSEQRRSEMNRGVFFLPMRSGNMNRKMFVLCSIALVALCLLGASSRQAWRTITTGSESHGFLVSGAGAYANLSAGQGGESAYLMLVSRPGGAAAPHVALISDADGSQRIQFRDDGGDVRTISLSRLADLLDSAAVVEEAP